MLEEREVHWYAIIPSRVDLASHSPIWFGRINLQRLKFYREPLLHG